MRRLVATAVLVIPFLAAVACGGRVGVVGGGGETCPSPAAVAGLGATCATAGQTCAGTVDVCGVPQSVDCTCTSGTWSCPDSPAGNCVVQCPPTNGVTAGSSCNFPAESPCTVAMTSTACDGIEVTGQCTCQSDGQGSGVWACVQAVEPECPDAQPPGCPDPSTVSDGSSCAVSPQLSCSSETPEYDCNGDIIGDVPCQCFGGAWSCVTPEPDCPPPGCPDPQNVEQGFSCVSPGQQCPGNPTDCDGAVFYDAFECDDGAWNDVATTACSGSSSSGSSSGGGGSVDAGVPDAKGI